MRTTKRCIDCREVLPLNAFRQRSGRPPGTPESCCRVCKNKRDRDRLRGLKIRTGRSLSTRTKHLRPLAHTTTLVHSTITDLFKGRTSSALARLQVAEVLLKRMLGASTPTNTMTTSETTSNG